MPHPVDDSSLVPKPPPPRPARRDAAIEAALRRFDGGEESPSTAASARTGDRSAWWARPQLGLAMTACLVAVIGIPVALTVIRNGSPPEASAPPPAPESRQEGPAQGASAPPSPLVEPVAQAPSANVPAQKQNSATTVSANKPADELAAAEPSAMAEAAPPPPPPPLPHPAAPMLAEKSSGEVASNAVVVTGSRIRTPNAAREETAAARAQAADVQAAPGWVLKDATYATFLERLQAAVRTNDRGAVIKLVGFPLRVNSNGRSRLYPDARSVRANYDRIFTPKVTQAIIGQRFDRLFGRDQGLMIGDGEIWFDHICSNSACSPPGPVRIKAVNL